MTPILLTATSHGAVPAPPSARGRRHTNFRTVAFLAAVLVVWGAAPQARAAAEDAGEPLDAKLERLEGGKLRLSELRGRPVLLELWATWCVPCKQQAVILEDLQPEIEARGVEVLAVDVGEAPKLVSAYLEKSPKTFPVALDRAQVLPRLLDIGELPVLAILDASGVVAGVHLGLAQPDEVRVLLDSVAPVP